MKKIRSSTLLQLPRARVFQWGKLLALTVSLQGAIQLLSLLTGLLIIRLLPMREYAYYTIANTVLGTMALLSDSGVNNGVMAHGGKVWQDRRELGAVLATGLKLRRNFSIINLCFSIPVLLFLLLHQGAGWPESLLIVVCLIPAFLATLTDSVLEIPYKLHQEISFLQTNQLMVGLGRFLLGVGALLVFPWTFILLITNGVPRLYGNFRLRKKMARIADLSVSPDPIVSKGMLQIVKRILPITIYYAYSSQIAIWIISLSGSAAAVAQIGALGRISMVLSLFSVLFGTVITPRFARLDASRDDLLRRFFQIIAFLLTANLFILLFCRLFSSEILRILGAEYSHLDGALFLSIAAASVSLFSGAVYGLYSSRGWTMQPLIPIGLNLGSVLAGILLFDVSTLKGILLFNLECALVQLLISLCFCTYKILNTRVTVSAV